MMCFSRLNPGIGKRLMQQTEPHSCACFTITLVPIRTADRSFGANGLKLVRSDEGSEAINQQKVLDAEIGGSWNNLHERPDLFSNQNGCGDCDFCSLVSHDFRGDDGRHL